MRNGSGAGRGAVGVALRIALIDIHAALILSVDVHVPLLHPRIVDGVDSRRSCRTGSAAADGGPALIGGNGGVA